MANRIIYPTEDGIAVIIMHDQHGRKLCDLPDAEIARKDVPAGVPFLIIGDSDIPSDRTYRDAWTADFSTPHGYGIGSEAWFAEQAGNGGEE